MRQVKGKVQGPARLEDEVQRLFEAKQRGMQ